MDQSFSWQNFDRMARVMETLGYIILVLGPIAGVLMLIFGEGFVSIAGIVVMMGSVLVAVYHICFSMTMAAIRGLIHDDPGIVPPKPE